MRHFAFCALAVALLVTGGCAKPSQTTSEGSPSPSPSPSAAAQATATASQSAAPEASGGPTSTPTPSPDPNLLSWDNGTIVRSYPAQTTTNPNNFVTSGVAMPAPGTQPFAIIFELAGQAQFTSFSADLPETSNNQTATVDIAVASDAANGSYHDVGTLTAGSSDAVKTLPASVTGRWVKITSNGPRFTSIAATGTLQPRPASAPAPAAVYVEDDQSPYADGTFVTKPKDPDPWYRRIATLGNSMSGVRCFSGRFQNGYPGTLTGREWDYSVDGAGPPNHAMINDEGTMIVGEEGSSPNYLVRADTMPKFCAAQKSGSGPHRVLVLDNGSQRSDFPFLNNDLPGYAYSRVPAAILDQTALAGADIAISNGLCDMSQFESKGQTDALLQWVNAGHKLIIVDADGCTKSTYAFLPYQFTTSNPGAKGATGDRLIIVESNALGSSDKTDASHFFDPKDYIYNGKNHTGSPSNQLGDANVVTTQDSHWCGHLFGTNANNTNGFMQMYAPYGNGIIIYSGFDHDDAGNNGYIRLRTLALTLPLPAGMPCTQSVDLSFLIQPTQEQTFTAGTAQTLRFSMEALANLGWKGHVAVTASGPFPATIAPASFDLAGNTEPLKLAINVPASAKAGVYTIDVSGDDGAGHTAKASVTLTALAPLPVKKKIIKHQRIRVYGIHFDVDSAHIQPQSEKVIKQIAELMKANPTTRFQVEGHTDSDGGAAYNLGLSQRRAQSVVDDLVKRYGIARSRLVPKGFGLTRPIAPNTTAANKALNRRVELLAL